MFKEFEVVELTHDIKEYCLKIGDRGTVVEIYDNGKAYEIEFFSPDGDTSTVITLMPSDICTVTLDYFRGFVTPKYNSNVTITMTISDENNILNNLGKVVGIDKFNTKLEKGRSTEDLKKSSYITA